MNLAIALSDPTEVPPLQLVLIMLSLFALMITFVVVMVWLGQRKRERAAYYRHEMERRLIEKGEATQGSLLEMRRAEHRQEWKRRREGLRLGGLLSIAMGVGMLMAAWQMEEIGLRSGWIPLVIGLVLFAYGQWISPKQLNGKENGEGA